jgi:MFS family permease
MPLMDRFLPSIKGVLEHVEILSRKRGKTANPPRVATIYRDELILNMVTLCFFLTIHSVVPYLSQYAVEIGATEAAVALLGPFFALSALTIRPLSGILADRGWTKRLLAIGAATSAAAQAIYFIAPGPELLYVGRLIQGAAVALFIPASFQAASIGSRETVISSLAWRSTVIGVSFALGPAIGGYVVTHLGYRALFIFSTAMALSASVLSLMINSAKLSRPVVSIDSDEKSLGFMSAGFITALASLLLYSSVYASMTLFLPAYHKEAGLGASYIAIFFTGIAVSSLVSRITFTYVLRVISVEGTAILGMILLSMGYILVSTDPLSHSILYYGIIAGIGSGLAIPSLQIMAITGVPQRRRGTASAIYTAMFDLGNMTGPIMVASIAKTYRDMIGISSYASLVALMPIALLQILRLKRSLNK